MKNEDLKFGMAVRCTGQGGQLFTVCAITPAKSLDANQSSWVGLAWWVGTKRREMTRRASELTAVIQEEKRA